MKKGSPIKDIKTIEQIKSLYKKKQNYRDLLIFLLGINTGIKITELLKLNVEDVKGKEFLVYKNKCPIPLNDEIKELIKKIIMNKKLSAPLFSSIRGKRLDREMAFRSFREICAELALGEEISIASWRRTFGYYHYQKFKDLAFLQWLFGQSTVELTLKFIDVQENMSLRFREGVAL